MSSSLPELKVDFCSYDAAKLAVLRWHYSHALPAGKLVKVGCWEGSEFVGCIIYSLGSNRFIGSPYGLEQTEVCELTRVALRPHGHFVSSMLAKSLRLLKEHCPGLRLVVSYADPNQGHHGGIYQATNWIFVGDMAAEQGIMIHGKLTHRRSLNARYGTSDIGWIKRNLDPHASIVGGLPKHKYLMPLDGKMRRKLLPLSKPYPKRDVNDSTPALDHAQAAS